VSILLLAVISFFLFSHLKRKFVIISIIAADVIFIASKFFMLDTVALLSLGYLVSTGVIFVFINASEYRYYILNNLKNKKNDQINVSLSKEQKYQLILETVKHLSRTKTGAIITFEKTTNLNDVAKTGTILNAPICQELLATIFYPGTRLHDGAVIVRGDKILAASVYFQPTTRALTGKYGARHRAAFGISEISDAVTVVVSEETGRISLTYKGTMESCTYDSFLNEFIAMIEDKEQ
jgi:diadenylate cyclase